MMAGTDLSSKGCNVVVNAPPSQGTGEDAQEAAESGTHIREEGRISDISEGRSARIENGQRDWPSVLVSGMP
jgi:hypothetical protein